MKLKDTFLLILFFAMTTGTQAQLAKGIKFEAALTWTQIKEKAKREGKFIFVDCYTTWCGPCKQMDQQVYINDSVGRVFNKGFISVKMQMDKTPKDLKSIRQQYADAEMLINQYQINAFPTLLFFNPDGELAVREVGFRGPNEFIELSDIVKDPNKQYFALLKQYKQGVKNYVQMANLAIMAKENGDLKVAEEIAKEYLRYVSKNLSKEQLLTPNNYRFHVKFESLITTKDLFFQVSLTEPNRINKLAESVNGAYLPGIANVYVQLGIIHDEIDPLIYKDGVPVETQPNWEAIERRLVKVYPNKVDVSNLVYGAKQRFYEKKKDWESFADVVDAYYTKNPPRTYEGLNSDWWRLNAMAYGYFKKVNDHKLLNRALTWVNESLRLDSLSPKPNPQIYDTKAHLLYKLGRIAEAISWEIKAIEIDTKQAIEKGLKKGVFFEEYTKYIEKMKKGEPTWPIQN